MDEGREDGDGSISEECQREGRAQGKSPEANSGIDPTQANNDKKPTATTITTSTEQPGIKENAKNESKSPKNTVTPAQSGPQDTDLPQLSTGAFVHFRPISTIFTGTNPTTAGTTGATKGSVSRANSRLRSKQKDKKKSPSRTVEAKSTDEIPAYYNFPFRKMFFNRATGELGKTPTLVPSTGPGCAKEE